MLPSVDRDRLFTRIAEALSVIQKYDPKLMDRVRQAIPVIWVPGPFYAYGAYDVDLKACVLASAYVLSSKTTTPGIAGTIVHEAVHARVWTPYYETSAFARARTERICLKAQTQFLRKIPGTSELVRTLEEETRADPVTWSDDAMKARRKRFISA
jgi:hypothetical protein